MANTVYVQWKYRSNPFDAVLAVCEEDGQIIGCDGLMTVPLKIGHLTERCAIGADLMVHPRFRRQGIFIEMCRYLDDETACEISLTYGTQIRGSPTIRGLTKYRQSRCIGDILVLRKYLLSFSALMRLWAYPRPTSRLLAKYLGALAELTMLSIFANLVALSNRLRRVGGAPPDRGDIKIREIEPLVFNDEFDNLWEKIQESFSVIVVRTKEYLRWRYANPESSYVGFRADQDGVLCGYCLLSYTSAGKLKYAWIADLFASNRDIAGALLERASDRAKRDQAHVLTMWGNKETLSISGSLGFRRGLSRKSLIVTLNSSEIPEDLVYDISNWYLTVGDTDDGM